MLDRIKNIQSVGGDFDHGYANAELDINPSSWFFKYHFQNDRVMPGSFLVESLWQLTGFHLAWVGHKGNGRVFDSGRTIFRQPIKPCKQTLEIEIQIKRTITKPIPICIANGQIYLENEIVCSSKNMKIGLVRNENN